MFTAEQREQTRQRILEVARADTRVIAGALTGSMALGAGDQWSDIDMAFGIVEDISPEIVLDDWTTIFAREWGVLDHFDLSSGSSIYRVFLFPNGLEADVAVTPARDFGARGPRFHALFGPVQHVPPAPQPNVSLLIGLSWHHVLHARVSIERQKLWQAEYWIGAIREHILDLACLRLGENARERRGVDRLPNALTDPLIATLVRSLDEPELRRALAAATHCLVDELDAWDAPLCARLAPLLREFGMSQLGASASPDGLMQLEERGRS